jgi:membrane fusion protein, multidrug efflux system
MPGMNLTEPWDYKRDENYRYKMRYTIIKYFFIAGLLSAPGCNSEPPRQENPQAIRDSIAEYRQQILGLNREISRLERQLAGMGERVQARDARRVRVIQIQAREFTHYFTINGSAEAVLDATISPEINGQITGINVARGDRVAPGQMIAQLNTSVIETNIEEVRTNLELAEIVYERQRRLWEQDIGSEMQYLEARNTYRSLQQNLASLESQLGLARLQAPFAGIVDDIFLKQGEVAMPGAPVMRIINLDNLYINTDISERYLPLVNPDDSVILRFPVYPDFEEYVPIHRLGNIINPENRTFRLQLLISNRQQRLKPNMVASLGIRTLSVKNAVVVPSALIKQDVQGHYVFVAYEDEDGNYYVEQNYVERGPESEGKTIIERGLVPGELLITDGHNRVGQGDFVQLEDQ